MHEDDRYELQPEPILLAEEFDTDTRDNSVPPATSREAARRVVHRRGRLSLILWTLTCISTFLVGMTPGGGPMGVLALFEMYWLNKPLPPLQPFLLDGLSYCLALMGILLFHEMGHFLQSVRYGVPATYPFFIPYPLSPLGTMGAVIFQDARSADRRKLFDIAISGPLAGLLLAIPICYAGVLQSQTTIINTDAVQGGVVFVNPPILEWMIERVHGPLAENVDVETNPLLFAGWVGLLITGINLLPVGQLDGGHILYTLIGRKAKYVGILVLAGALAFMVLQDNYIFLIMLMLLMVMGPGHPPTANDRAPLGIWRTCIGWLTLAFIFIGFTPIPFKFY